MLVRIERKHVVIDAERIATTVAELMRRTRVPGVSGRVAE